MKTENTFHWHIYICYRLCKIHYYSFIRCTGLVTSSLLCLPALTSYIIRLSFFVARPGRWKTHFSFAGPARWKTYFSFASPTWKNHLSFASSARPASWAWYGPVQTARAEIKSQSNTLWFRGQYFLKVRLTPLDCIKHNE